VYIGSEGESKHELSLIVALKKEQLMQQTVTSLETRVFYLRSFKLNTKAYVQKRLRKERD
jgi:hypothetical protein